jgi:hypothetical protein
MNRIKVGLAALAIGVVAIALVPAISSGGPGKLVAKEVGKGKSPVAVPTATVQNPGKLTLKIKAKPAGTKVFWGYTTDCYKDGEHFEYPKPGDYEDKVAPSGKVTSGIKKVVRNPDYCDIAASAKLNYKAGKKVVAKIFNR